MAFPFTFTQGFAVEQQFHLFAIRYDIYRFHRMLRIVPVSDDVSLELVRIHPAVPHYLVGEEGVFLYTHGVGHAAAAVVLLTAIMCVGVGEDDFRTACTDP